MVKEIILEKEYGKKLGMSPTAKKLFQNVNNEEEIILNFENIEFMSRSFAQEYVFQRHYSNTDINEINLPDSISQLLDIVDDDFKESCIR